jgi:LPXTG-site transpeptidase (sortase) family protein
MTRVRTGYLFWSLCLVGVIVAIAATFTSTQHSDSPVARDLSTQIAPAQPSLDQPESDSLLVEPAPTQLHAPVRLRVPGLGISADVMSVGMQDEVTMEVPEDIGIVGWFQYGATPASDTGTTVLVGHRDGTEDPNGVFRDLSQIETGDRILVTDESGTRWRYEVSRTDVLDAAQFATAAERIFDMEKAPRLILITCGGEFIRSEGGYQSNTVVVARPVSD